MKSCAILSFVPMTRDPRIHRQLRWLEPYYRLWTLGPANARVPGVACLDIGLQPGGRVRRAARAGLLLQRRYEHFYWQSPHVRVTLSKLRLLRPDLIVANDIETLPLALLARRLYGSRVLVDLHEYFPDAYEADPVWKLLVKPYMNYLCRRYLPEADALTTVSPGLVKLYREHSGVEMELILNTPPYQDLTLRPTDPERLRIIHHGYAAPDRRLESLIALTRQLDARFDLTLMLLPDGSGCLERLRRLAADEPRVYFREPVPMSEIVSTIHAYDIGIFLLPPVQQNYTHALPNKLFEFMQARLAVAVSPNPDMANLVREVGYGLVSPSAAPETMAPLLNRLDAAAIDSYKLAAHRASARYCAETVGEHFVAIAQALCPSRF